MTRRTSVLLVVLLVVSPIAGGLLATGVDATAARSSHGQNACTGTITGEPSGTTLFTIQGARAGEKTHALMVGVRPNGSVIGVHDDTEAGRWWLYDVDRTANGSLLSATTGDRITIVESVDPRTGDHQWTWRLPNVKDAHDVDALGDGEYVLVDKGAERNRVVIYNRTTDELVWEWRFDGRFPESGGGPYGEDWTHVNDVDEIRDGVFLVSVRNFDQAIAIDRESKEILWRLGSDDDHEILNEQHNPDFIAGDQPTVLVADSENDRVVEYAREDGEWVKTWELSGDGLSEPRDADRLPNGNTLIADRRGHRILEVTPRGEVVWEFYAPWQPYDVERIGTGDESSGPTARQLGATGSYEMTGSEQPTTEELESCYDYLLGVERTQLLAADELPDPATVTGTVTGTTDEPSGSSTATTVWTTVPQTTRTEAIGPLVGVLVAALVVLVGWSVHRRRR